jgi:hypothetical protein
MVTGKAIPKLPAMRGIPPLGRLLEWRKRNEIGLDRYV